MSYNKFHILRENDKLNLQKYFLFIDTETKVLEYKDYNKDEKEMQLLKLGWCIFYNREANTSEELFFNTNIVLWNHIFKLLEQYKNIIIFAHNIDFDFKIINAFHYLTENKFIKSKYYLKDTTFICEFKKEKNSLLFLDTMNYVPTSLKKIGESLKLPKLEIDFNKCTDKELKEYCLNDTRIIYEFIKKLLDFLQEYNLSKLKPTVASLSFNIFRHNFYNRKEKPIYIHTWQKAIQLEKDSYRGGICDCLKIGKYVRNKYYKLDVNSMYPNIMKNKEMPTKIIFYGDIHSFSSKSLVKELNRSVKKYHIIAHVKISLPKEYAYLLIRGKINKEKKAFFLSGEYETTLTTPELLYVLKYGKIKECYRLAIYKKEIIFNSFVDFFYKKRLEFIKEENGVYELFCKIILNSLYGKFGQKSSEMLLVGKSDTSDIKSYTVIEGNTKAKYIKFAENIYLMSDLEENSFDSFIAIPSLVTAYARMYLIELLLIAKRDNCYYLDTDCIITNEKGFKKLIDFIDFNNKRELGKLKIESEAFNIEIIKPKMYSFGDDKKCKGIKKNSDIIFQNDDLEIYSNTQFQRMTTALNTQNTDSQIITYNEKIVNKKYDKGIVKNNEVIPYCKNP